MDTNNQVVGRLAPSPTGALHLGNARSFLLAWLSARSAAGKCYLRIEDIDSPRVKPQSVRETIETLKWLGLDWDHYEPGNEAAPTNDESKACCDGIPVQSHRLPRYSGVLKSLIDQGTVYACSCTRSQVQSAASAPHESLLTDVTFALDGPVYPGTCRTGKAETTSAESFAWRWKFDDTKAEFDDKLLGRTSIHPHVVLGDFVVAKKDATPAYQLAVVVDDYDMGVTQVVRGDDLVASTFRQIAILDYLGWPRPEYCHVPLMIGPDGRRLAKRHGDTRVSFFRDNNCTAESIVGYLAYTAGLMDTPEPTAAADLVDRFGWAKVDRSPTTVEQAAVLKLCRRQSS